MTKIVGIMHPAGAYSAQTAFPALKRARTRASTPLWITPHLSCVLHTCLPEKSLATDLALLLQEPQTEAGVGGGGRGRKPPVDGGGSGGGGGESGGGGWDDFMEFYERHSPFSLVSNLGRGLEGIARTVLRVITKIPLFVTPCLGPLCASSHPGRRKGMAASENSMRCCCKRRASHSRTDKLIQEHQRSPVQLVMLVSVVTAVCPAG